MKNLFRGPEFQVQIHHLFSFSATEKYNNTQPVKL